MSASILVTFATRYGSTAEVAGAAAECLQGEGLGVTLQPVHKVSGLEDYTAVILGAPLYMFRLHKGARRFLDRFRTQLENLPVAVFSLGPFHDDENEWKEAREQLDKELAKHPWLKPVSIRMIGGRFDPASLRFPFSWIPALKRMEPVDIRDWKSLNTWVKSLVPLITPPGGSDKQS